MNTEKLLQNKRQRPMTVVVCAMCGKEFERPLFRHTEAVKLGLNEFCGGLCRNKFKTTSVIVQCALCSKEVSIYKSVFDSSSNKMFFCNHACAASYNNKKRGPLNVLTRNKIKNSLNDRHLSRGTSRKRICPICDKEFQFSGRSCVCCSKRCGTIYKFGFEPCSKDEIVNIIIELSRKTGRTPMRRETQSRVYHAATRLFGSWNKAIESCGLKSNGNSPRNVKIKCSDGHVVRSISEKVIDEWLTQNNIRHEIEKPYPVGKYTCDFYLPDHELWIEYFGLAGAFEEYDEAIRVKNKMVADHSLNLISIFPKHLYPECKLKQMIPINSVQSAV